MTAGSNTAWRILGVDPGAAHAGFVFFEVPALQSSDTPLTLLRKAKNLRSLTYHSNLRDDARAAEFYQWMVNKLTKPIDLVVVESVIFRPNRGGHMSYAQAAVYTSMVLVGMYYRREGAKFLAVPENILQVNRSKVFSLWGFKIRSHDKERKLHQLIDTYVTLQQRNKHVKDALAVGLAGAVAYIKTNTKK